jgi:hypothetical protein
MKRIFTLLILALSTVYAQAKHVDYGAAMQVANYFYQQTTGKTVNVKLAELGNLPGKDGKPVAGITYYAFNVPGNNGFVIVSAEDVVKPILAYGTTGQFKLKNAPVNITGWLDKYSREILYAKTNIAPATQDIADQWNGYTTNTVKETHKQARSGSAVLPLLQTTWDQDLYYNAMCPSDPNSEQGYGGNVPTGCGATAMSQIMRYWGYPAQGTGSNSYNSNYGTLSVNFGATTYNWANMPTALTSANADVATIMFDCGVAVDMVYTYDESSSYMVNEGGVPASCEAAYTTYFGYNPATIQGLDRSNYATDAAWTALIDIELANNRPIQYAGAGSDGGHTFVLDGSDGQGNYHINWGWNGTDNGYYSVDALTPAPYSNGSFSDGEQMLTGIEPLGATAVTSGINLYQATTVNPDPIEFLTLFTVTANVVNTGTAAFSGSYCAALFDATGTFIRYIGDVLSTGNDPLAANNHYTNPFTFTDTTTAVTIPGIYTIGIYYQPTGATTWTLASPAAYTNPITVTVSGPVDPGISLDTVITVTPATLVQGSPASVNVNLLNDNSTGTYTGMYEAVLLDLQGNYVETIGTYTESQGLPAGYTYLSPYLTFSSSNITAAEGQYILAIAEEASGTSDWYYCGQGSYSNPVKVNVVNNDIGVLGIQPVAADAVNLYPNPATNVVAITSDGQPMSVTIYDLAGQEVLTAQIQGKTTSLDISTISKGAYLVKMQQEGNTYTRKLVVE